MIVTKPNTIANIPLPIIIARLAGVSLIIALQFHKRMSLGALNAYL